MPRFTRSGAHNFFPFQTKFSQSHLLLLLDNAWSPSKRTCSLRLDSESTTTCLISGFRWGHPYSVSCFSTFLLILPLQCTVTRVSATWLQSGSIGYGQYQPPFNRSFYLFKTYSKPFIMQSVRLRDQLPTSVKQSPNRGIL